MSATADHPCSVLLEPVDSNRPIGDEELADLLARSVEVMRERTESAGVEGVDFSVEGSGIRVRFAESVDSALLIELVTARGELTFRPVLGVLSPTTPKEQRAELETRQAELRTEVGLAEGVTALSVLAEEQQALSALLQADPEATPPEGPQNSAGIDVTTGAFQELAAIETQLSTKLTAREDIKVDQPIVLADAYEVYQLGPTFSSGDRVLEGEAVEDATAGLNQQGAWVVNPKFREGADGIDLFNEAAAACYNGDATVCPAQDGGRGRLAIVLDGEVLTAPSINEATFGRDQIEISGTFDQDSAQSVAAALVGPLPLELRSTAPACT